MRLILYFLAGIAGIGVGVLSALWMSGLIGQGAGASDGTVEIAGWRSDFDVGSEAADPYTRARIARYGLLAMSRTEAVYFTRAADDSGQPLSENCRYRMSGAAMPAQWWSITAYDGDSRLPMNDDQALSIDASRAGEGAWQAIIAPERPDDASFWISSRNAGQFDLTLRLYVPDAALIENPDATLIPPRIERLDCEGAA